MAPPEEEKTDQPVNPRQAPLAVSDFTLSGRTLDSSPPEPAQRSRERRLLIAYLALGLPATSVFAALLLTTWESPQSWSALLLLGLFAGFAQYFPVHVSYANISLGVGFLLAACLLAGPAPGSLVVALMFLVWSLTRELLPWFRYARGVTLGLRLARTVYTVGVAGLVYCLMGHLVFAAYHLRPPVGWVAADSLGASVALAMGVYLLLNLTSLTVSRLSGDNTADYLKTEIPLSALAELFALPTALSLVVIKVQPGGAAFFLLSWLYLVAAFLGWRSWQDRENVKQRLQDVELLHRAGASISGTLEMTDLVRRFKEVVREVAHFHIMLLMIDEPGERFSQHFAFDGRGERLGPSPAPTPAPAPGSGGSDSHPGAEPPPPPPPMPNQSGPASDSGLEPRQETSFAALEEETSGLPEGLFCEPEGGSTFVRDLLSSEEAQVRLRLDFTAGMLADHDLVLLETICQQAGAALSNARLYRLANKDPLTGVAIRRYFERALRQTRAHGEIFSIIMLDLDWFKRVNDLHGHRAGDTVLQDLADVLLASLRVSDVVARYGGEEFVIMLPGLTSAEAAAVAERIRRILDQNRLMIDEKQVRYTASFGVASSQDLVTACDPMEVVWMADAALLAAKRAGRNQVVTYSALDRTARGAISSY